MTDSTPCTWPTITLPHGLRENARIAGNALARSAVFSTLDYSGSAQRPQIDEPLQLATIAPYHIEQLAGVRLSQTDADLLYWLLSRAYRSGTPSGSPPVFFKRGEALAALDRVRGGKTDALLSESLSRLADAMFSFEYLGVTNQIRLLSGVVNSADSSKPWDCMVTLESSLGRLLDHGEWLVLPGKVRAELSGEPLALGLHAFYASHKTAFPMLPATLKALMGRESMQDSKWRNALKRALSQVRIATDWEVCELAEAGPYQGKVVVRKGSKRRAPLVKKRST